MNQGKFVCFIVIVQCITSCTSISCSNNSIETINPKLRYEILAFHYWDTSFTNNTKTIRLGIYNLRDTTVYSISHEIDATSEYAFNRNPLMIIPINNLNVLVYYMTGSEIGISKTNFKSFLKKTEPDNWSYYLKNHESMYTWKIVETSSWQLLYLNGKFLKREINAMWR